MICKVAPSLKAFLKPLTELRPNPANLRLHDAKNVEAIGRSWKRFGQQTPIVADADGIILVGNGRYTAAKALGWTHVAAIVTDLQGADTAAYAIADNHTAELAAWDPGLADVLEALRREDEELFAATGYLMELDALYCDVIVQRWERFTGKKAERPEVPAPEAAK